MTKKSYAAPTIVELGRVGELTRTEIKCNGSADAFDIQPPLDTRPGIVINPGDPVPEDCAL